MTARLRHFPKYRRKGAIKGSELMSSRGASCIAPTLVYAGGSRRLDKPPADADRSIVGLPVGWRVGVLKVVPALRKGKLSVRGVVSLPVRHPIGTSGRANGICGTLDAPCNRRSQRARGTPVDDTPERTCAVSAASCAAAGNEHPIDSKATAIGKADLRAIRFASSRCKRLHHL